MAQNVNLKLSGINTAQSDLDGNTPGALDIADNVEIRYRNVAQPRRGLDELPGSFQPGITYDRLANFYVDGVMTIVTKQSDGQATYYDADSDVMLTFLGDVSTNLENPDDVFGKCRFVHGGQNLYLTTKDGVRSTASASGSNMVRAGVAKALNIDAETNGDTSGFLDYNFQVNTGGYTQKGSFNITNLSDLVGIAAGQYIDCTGFSVGTIVEEVIQPVLVLTTTGNIPASTGSFTITGLQSVAGLYVPGLSANAPLIVTGPSIPLGAYLTSFTPASGNFNAGITVPNNGITTAVTGTSVAFSIGASLVASEACSTGVSGVFNFADLNFYNGSQTAYQVIFGRVEFDINGVQTTRVGSPVSQPVIVTNIEPNTTNTVVTFTIPKNVDQSIDFYQVFRTQQTQSGNISPQAQYNLNREGQLTDIDFDNRIVTYTDDIPDSELGISLYSGSDQEGALQPNDPPPMAFDICKYRDFLIYGNVTYPTSTKFTILSVGAPSGIQPGDTITIAGVFGINAFSGVYLAGTSESQATHQFQIFTNGTPQQNIAQTAASLIRVINYDENCPVHAINQSTGDGLAGQIGLEADYPSGRDTFTITANLHSSAYSPALNTLLSDVNLAPNYIAVSKSGEQEAVPALNNYAVGDAYAGVYRLIPIRDYVFCVKGDGIYRISGTDPTNLSISIFDPTVRVVGVDTVTALNSALWMLSNQGVVSIGDGGVQIQSLPIDDQLQFLIDNFYDSVNTLSFGIGYENDRKYVLAVPSTDSIQYCDTEFNYNYTTNAWTTWSRDFYTGFFNLSDYKLYFARADAISQGISKERKTNSNLDYVDEANANTILNVSGNLVILLDASRVVAGDVLYQNSIVYSIITNVAANTVTVLYAAGFVAGSCEVRAAYLCNIQWKQVVGQNPAFVKTFREGILLFKVCEFNTANALFFTDYSAFTESVPIMGIPTNRWGRFPWGSVSWGSQNIPFNRRFIIPANKQIGSYIMPSFQIREGLSQFVIQGMSISWEDVSEEVGN